MKYFFSFFLILSAFMPDLIVGKSYKKQHLIVCPTSPEKHGMFSCCDLVLSSLFLYEKGYFETPIAGLSVNFGQQGLYYNPKHGDNWWTYYFEPIETGSAENVPSRFSTARENEIAWGARQRYKVTKKQAHRIIRKYIKVKPAITKKVNNFVKRNFSDHYVIGVHYRGTDKIHSQGIKRITLNKIVKHIKSQIANIGNKPYKIFVATDEASFLKQIKDIYANKIIAIEAVRSTSTTPVHHLMEDRYLIGEQALIDALLLSKCNYLIRTSSNLSLWSTFFNPDLPVILLSQNHKGE